MTDINSMDALIAHRAKLREEVIELNFVVNEHIFGGEALIKRADVLKLLNRD